MARPKDSDSAAVMAKVLATTRNLIEVEGVSAASVRRVAKESGITPTTVRYYFENREGLLEAVLDEPFSALSDMVAELGPIFAEVSGVDPMVEVVVPRCYRFALQWRAALRLNLMVTLDRGFLLPRRQANVQADFLRRAAQGFATLAGVSPDAMRLAVQSAVFVVVRWALLDERELRLIIGNADELSLAEVHERVGDFLVEAVRGFVTPRPE